MSLWYDVNMIKHLVCGWDVFQNSVHCSIIESKYPTWTEVQFRTSYVNFGVNFLSYIESIQDFSVDPLPKSHLDWRWKISWKSDFSLFLNVTCMDVEDSFASKSSWILLHLSQHPSHPLQGVNWVQRDPSVRHNLN